MPTPTLEVQLFGDFSLRCDGVFVTTVSSPKLQSLLAYLLLNRHRRQTRQHLAFLFWPDTGEKQARTNLRNLLHQLRRAWPEAEHFLRIETKTVQWRPETPYTLDVAAGLSDGLSEGGRLQSPRIFWLGAQARGRAI